MPLQTREVVHVAWGCEVFVVAADLLVKADDRELVLVAPLGLGAVTHHRYVPCAQSDETYLGLVAHPAIELIRERCQLDVLGIPFGLRHPDAVSLTELDAGDAMVSREGTGTEAGVR